MAEYPTWSRVSTRESDAYGSTLDRMMMAMHACAKDHGFWEANQQGCEPTPAEKIALTHGELSEWLEGLRHGDGPSDHLPEFKQGEEEAADTIIRILDLCGKLNYRIGAAVMAKMQFNESRPRKHGKLF